MNEKLVKVAMNMILKAGDSRTMIQNSMKSLEGRDFSEAEKYLSQAEVLINNAHIEQTEVIQKATAGESFELDLIFIHAQDTLMTINSELIIAHQMLTLFKSFYFELKGESNEESINKIL